MCTSQHQTFSNVQTDATTPNNAGSCWPTMLRPFARGFMARSVKCVTRKVVEVSRCSRAKQRQRNVQKRCAERAKLFFANYRSADIFCRVFATVAA